MARIWIQNTAGKRKIIEGGRAFLNSLELRLYVVPLTLSGTVMPNLGDECTDGGYALAANPFPNAFAAFSTWARAVGINQVWTFDHDGGDFTCEGIFWTDPNDGDETIMACAADVPFDVTAPGQIFVAPTLFDFGRWGVPDCV